MRGTPRTSRRRLPGPAGIFRQRTILGKLGIDPPKKIIELDPGDLPTSNNTIVWTHARTTAIKP